MVEQVVVVVVVHLQVQRLEGVLVGLQAAWAQDGVVGVAGVGGRRGLYVDLHVLAQGAGVRVGLGAAQRLAVVGLGGRVYLGVLLAVAAVGEPSLAELALEGLLPWRTTTAVEVSVSRMKLGSTRSIGLALAERVRFNPFIKALAWVAMFNTFTGLALALVARVNTFNRVSFSTGS